MSRSRLISLGYEGRTVAELIEHLHSENVTLLIDVRLTPLSRKPGMSKRRLEAALAAAGIGYLHLKALGNPRENRAAFRAGEPQSRNVFRAMLRQAHGKEAMKHVAELLDGETIALLCFERDHHECHRLLVVEELRRARPELELVAL